MKKFDLKLAKAGHPVCTRDGNSARIICFDANNVGFPIIALVTIDNCEHMESYTPNGTFYKDEEKDGFDLMMVSEKKEGWINIYQYAHQYNSGSIYKTKDEALKHKCDGGYVTTTKIEWEE